MGGAATDGLAGRPGGALGQAGLRSGRRSGALGHRAPRFTEGQAVRGARSLGPEVHGELCAPALSVNWGLPRQWPVVTPVPRAALPAPGQAPRGGGDTHLLTLGALQTSDAVRPLCGQRG